ncbi:MAG: C69 family dipeptidase [Promethearchaeota archaeon]
MCDTLVALKNSTTDGSVILAKNSDREPNEPQALFYFPRQTYDPEKEVVQATYIQVPQVEETYAVLLSSPNWIFGCEMGANEFGVTIGNEAVFTREPYRDSGLIGMDFIRLALERGKTAQEALDIIVDLLEKYGQGGNCALYATVKYHNSFLIADPQEAWVLETADKFWIAEKVQDIRSISNALSIGTKYDRIHPDLIKHALDKGYCKSEEHFHFAKSFVAGVTEIRTWGSKGLKRQACTTESLQEKKGEIDVAYMMNILRNHNIQESKKDQAWTPEKGGMNSICIHIKPIIAPAQTTASMVSHLLPEIQTHWVTGTAAPCTSLFKPVFIESGLPDIGPTPTKKFTPQSLWWQHEQIHRSILEDYATRIQILQPEIEQYESKWLERVSEIVKRIKEQPIDQRKEPLAQLTEEAFQEAQEIEKKWLAQIKKTPIKKSSGRIYRRFWNSQNKTVDFKI